MLEIRLNKLQSVTKDLYGYRQISSVTASCLLPVLPAFCLAARASPMLHPILTNYLKTLVVGYHRRFQKKECR